MKGLRRVLGNVAMAMACLMVVAIGPVAAQTPSPDSLVETYQDWTVRCETPENAARRCWMNQSLQRTEGGERVLVVEFFLIEGKPLLVMVAPFGLLLEKGARLDVDGTEVATVPFHTCRPGGCFLRNDSDEALIAALRRGDTLNVAFVVAQNNGDFSLAVSLAGFSAAFNRLQALARS